jgi:hypothetical protein
VNNERSPPRSTKPGTERAWTGGAGVRIRSRSVVDRSRAASGAVRNLPLIVPRRHEGRFEVAQRPEYAARCSRNVTSGEFGSLRDPDPHLVPGSPTAGGFGTLVGRSMGGTFETASRPSRRRGEPVSSRALRTGTRSPPAAERRTPAAARWKLEAGSWTPAAGRRTLHAARCTLHAARWSPATGRRPPHLPPRPLPGQVAPCSTSSSSSPSSPTP